MIHVNHTLSSGRVHLRGNAMVMVLVAATLLSALAIALSDSAMGRISMQQQRRASDMLTVLTESAANEALADLRAKASADPGLINPVARGGRAPDQLYDPDHPTAIDPEDPWYEVAVATTLTNPEVSLAVSCRRVETTKAVYDQLVEPDRDDLRRTFIVRAIGRMRERGELGFSYHMVEMRVFAVDGLAQGLLANESYRFYGSADVDWFNSAAGPYVAPTTSLDRALLASNSTVLVDKPGNVKSSPTDSDGAQMPMQAVSFPSDASSYRSLPPVAGGVITVDSTQSPYYVAAIDGAFSGVTCKVTGGGTVKIYVSGTISGFDMPVDYGDATSRLVIVQDDYNTPAAPISEKINGNTSAGAIRDPGRLAIMSAFSGELQLNGTADFGGVYYAPKATIRMNGTFNWYGAMVAAHFGDLTTWSGGTPYQVYTPAAGDQWTAGTTGTVRWEKGAGGGSVTISLSLDGGATWTTETTSDNDGVCSIALPSTANSTNCMVQVADSAGGGSATSQVFTINSTQGNPDNGKVNGNFHFHYDTNLINFPELSSLQVDQWRADVPTPDLIPPSLR
jgi:hypothetical protein